MSIPDLLNDFFDDAAIFPPGNKPLPQAVADHLALPGSDHSDMVGPLVLPIGRLAELEGLLGGPGSMPFALSVTVRGSEQLRELAGAVAGLSSRIAVKSVEISLPVGTKVESAMAEIGQYRLGDAYVEVPRDDRRDAVLAALGEAGFQAKFRTGGVRADLYPDERELAGSLLQTIGLGLAFKATAGLHHAIRNRDALTGFEQHGFLNLLMATDVALDGGELGQVAAVLAERDGQKLSRWAMALSSDRAVVIRQRFQSFGTCSVEEPVADLVALGLLQAKT